MNCATGKRPFVTRAEASRAAKMLQKRHGSGRARSYRCTACEWFHIGNAPKGLLHGDFGRDETRHS